MFAEVYELLDKAAEVYDAVRGGHVAERAEQFACHLATARMAVDLTQEFLSKENA